MSQLDINGKAVSLEVPADTALLWVLRDELGLTGTHESWRDRFEQRDARVGLSRQSANNILQSGTNERRGAVSQSEESGLYLRRSR